MTKILRIAEEGSARRLQKRLTFRANRNVELPINDPCQLYPRVSTPEQKENMSAEMQQDKEFAIACGWEEDKVIVDDRDLGISGQTRMEDREAGREMIKRIQKGEIKAVLVRDVSRLFRNKWGEESGKFMETCFTYGILLVTEDFVFDFSISHHIEEFIKRCREAYAFIDKHVYGVMLPAKDEVARSGHWHGGNLTAGIIYDRREKIGGRANPEYNRPVPYEPHLERVRWLFKRNRELGCRTRELLREVITITRAEGYFFPAFEEWVPEEIIGKFLYKSAPRGYTIGTIHALESILQHPAYGQHWVYKNELCAYRLPFILVPEDDFMYSFTRLSPTFLDGTANESVLQRMEKRRKKHNPEIPAVLGDVLGSIDPAYKARTATMGIHGKQAAYYYLAGRSDMGFIEGSVLGVKAHDVDTIVLDRLRMHLNEPGTEATYKRYREDAAEDGSKEVTEEDEVRRDIEATRANMARLQRRMEDPNTDEDLISGINTAFKVAKAELARLEKRIESVRYTATEEERRQEWKELLTAVDSCWEDVVEPEDIPNLVEIFIEKVLIERHSPQFFSVHVYWKDPDWKVEQALCFRRRSTSTVWDAEEIEKYKRMYPTASREALFDAFPERSYHALCAYGWDHNIKREVKGRAPLLPDFLCKQEWVKAQELGIELEEIRDIPGSMKMLRWCRSSIQNNATSINKTEAISYLRRLLARAS